MVLQTRFIFLYILIHILPHIFGAVNKHIQSIGTRVRDFMVRFYRLKLVLRCVYAMICFFFFLSFFVSLFCRCSPNEFILHVGCSVARSLCTRCACHYRMKIESISLIYCSCSCMHSFFSFFFFASLLSNAIFLFVLLSICITLFFCINSVRIFSDWLLALIVTITKKEDICEYEKCI